jgi:simple sugar transport system permease protein
MSSAVQQAFVGGVEAGTVILLPALGELIGQRAGVINLGTEGALLSGALSAFAVASSTGSVWLGVLAGIGAGAACGLLHSWLVVRRGADQLASGLVIWFLALGVTSLFGTSYVGISVDPLPVKKVPGLSHLPFLGPVLFQHDLIVYLGYVLIPIVWFVLWRTRIGLLVRASGERSEVVATTGGRPQLVQMIAVTVGSGLAGLGGAQLSVAYVGNWFDNMTNGYGFVAVAVVLFAAWRPLAVCIGSLLFGVALASAAVVQAHGVAINQYLLDALPYVVTLLALVVFARRAKSVAPEALMRALSRSA